MRCTQDCSANGRDREECEGCEDRCPNPTPNLWDKTIDHLGNPCFCLLDEISSLKSIYHKFTPKSSYLGTSTCGSPSPCADTSFRHPREYVALQPPSDFLLISITRTGVTLALIQGSPFPTPSRLGRAHTSTCPAAASRSAHSALDRLGTPGCVGTGQRC